MACSGGPDTITNGLVLTLDAANLLSYIPPIIVYSVQCYSVYSGGLRSANYTVQYSDDNSTWTTAFTGVMSNNSACGIITGTGVNTSNLTPHRYWRYVEGAAVVGHHPRVSRIDFITPNGSVYNLITSTTDNCADSGIYIIGTISKDFGPSTWYDLSGTNNGTLTNGPTFSGGNGGSITFNGSNQYVDCGNVLASLTNLTLECFVKFGTQSTSYNGIISKTLSNTNGYEIRTAGYTSTTTTAQFRYVGDNGSPDFGALTNGVWYHLVATGILGLQLVYINGSIYNSGTYAGTPSANSNSLVIGKLAYAGLYANMTMGFARIYNRALSASEILQNYNVTKTRFGL